MVSFKFNPFTCNLDLVSVEEILWDREDGVLSPHNETDSVNVRGIVYGNSFTIAEAVELSHDGDGGLKVKSNIGSDASIIIDTYEDKAELRTMNTGDDEWVILSADYNEEWLDIFPNADSANINFCRNCSEGRIPYYTFYSWRTGDANRRAASLTVGDSTSGQLKFDGIDSFQIRCNTVGVNTYIDVYTRGDYASYYGSTLGTSIELLRANFDEGIVEINPFGEYDVFFCEKVTEGNDPAYYFNSWTTDRDKAYFYFDINKTVKDSVYFGTHNVDNFTFDGSINSDNFYNYATNNYWIGNTENPTPSSSVYNFFALDKAGKDLTTGDNNIGIGYYALNHITTSSYNIAIGGQSQLWNESGTSNICFGYRTGYYNKYGDYNIFIGDNAGKGDSTETTFLAGNICIGKEAGYDLLNGNEDNTYIGYQAGSSLRGNYNLCYGRFAGYNSSTQSTCNNNIFLGVSTARNHLDCDKNIVIGYNIDLVDADGDNQLNIGNLIFGTGLDGTGTTLSDGKIGIKTNNPASILSVNGIGEAGAFSVQGTLTGNIANFRDYDGENVFKVLGRISEDTMNIYLGDFDGVMGYPYYNINSESHDFYGDANIDGDLNVKDNLIVEGSLTKAYVSKSAAYTLTSSDYQVECTANTFTITLPTADGIAGREYSIKNTGTGTITVDGDSSETIDGATTQTLSQWENIRIMSNGTNWIIV